jgi:hypothetical protein
VILTAACSLRAAPAALGLTGAPREPGMCARALGSVATFLLTIQGVWRDWSMDTCHEHSSTCLENYYLG